jgi:hypothetical protein
LPRAYATLGTATLLVLAALSAPALAQSAPFAPNTATPFAPPPSPAGPGVSVPVTPRGPVQTREPHAFIPAVGSGRIALALAARFANNGPFIPRSLRWRVFSDKVTPGVPPTLVAEGADPAPLFALAPGEYVVHVAYGFVTAARRVTLHDARREIFELAAGGLRLQAKIGDATLPAQRVKFDIYEGSFLQRPGAGRAERPPVAKGINPGEIVLLPAGAYYVRSTYGDGNAVIQADLRVDVGKLAEATVHHRAAQITLRLVSAPGGEAIANTAWSVLTPGGDSVKESIGAFPTVILAEGDYVAIARNEGRIYTNNFRVESGKDREVEVLLSQVQRQEPAQRAPTRATR